MKQNDFGICQGCCRPIAAFKYAQYNYLCHECYYAACRQRRPSYLPNPRMASSTGGWERILTTDEREAAERWKDAIIEKIDRENKKHKQSHR
ncbi:MAG: hypothetical protein AB1599_05960 [Planctomycetota bacterium]